MRWAGDPVKDASRRLRSLRIGDPGMVSPRFWVDGPFPPPIVPRTAFRWQGPAVRGCTRSMENLPQVNLQASKSRLGKASLPSSRSHAMQGNIPRRSQGVARMGGRAHASVRSARCEGWFLAARSSFRAGTFPSGIRLLFRCGPPGSSNPRIPAGSLHDRQAPSCRTEDRSPSAWVSICKKRGAERRASFLYSIYNAAFPPEWKEGKNASFSPPARTGCKERRPRPEPPRSGRIPAQREAEAQAGHGPAPRWGQPRQSPHVPLLLPRIRWTAHAESAIRRAASRASAIVRTSLTGSRVRCDRRQR